MIKLYDWRSTQYLLVKWDLEPFLKFFKHPCPYCLPLFVCVFCIYERYHVFPVVRGLEYKVCICLFKDLLLFLKFNIESNECVNKTKDWAVVQITALVIYEGVKVRLGKVRKTILS